MSVRSLRIVPLALPLALASAACTFAVGFDGFVGKTEPGDGGGAEARSSVPAASNRGTDSSIDDVSSSDAGDASVADPNVGPFFLDAGHSYCGSVDASFCEDFDSEDLPVRWTKEGPFAKLTSYSAKSSPNDFLVLAPETTTGGTFVSKITHAFSASSTNLLIDFQFMPEKVNAGSAFFILAALEYTKGSAKYSLRLVFSNGQIRLEESNLIPPPNNQDFYHPFFSLQDGRWSHIKVDVVASGGSPGAQLFVDDAPIGVREMLTPTVGIDPTPTLILGAVFAGQPHTGWTLRYDDVTVTYR